MVMFRDFVWVGNILTPGKTSPKKLMDFGAFFDFSTTMLKQQKANGKMSDPNLMHAP